MKRTNFWPGSARKSKVRKWRLGLMAMTMGMTGAVLASAPLSTTPKEAQKASTSAKRSRFGIQFGKASWYGKKFNGRKTASGERFDMNALTCAHRSLPLGSWVRVTNVDNEKSVFLRVNDRGPVPRNRLMDLSYAAARKLGILGVSKVKIEPVAVDDGAMAKVMMAEARPPQFQLVDELRPQIRVMPELSGDR